MHQRQVVQEQQMRKRDLHRLVACFARRGTPQLNSVSAPPLPSHNSAAVSCPEGQPVQHHVRMIAQTICPRCCAADSTFAVKGIAR
jgi:hypothetical protein